MAHTARKRALFKLSDRHTKLVRSLAARMSLEKLRAELHTSEGTLSNILQGGLVTEAAKVRLEHAIDVADVVDASKVAVMQLIHGRTLLGADL